MNDLVLMQSIVVLIQKMKAVDLGHGCIDGWMGRRTDADGAFT